MPRRDPIDMTDTDPSLGKMSRLFARLMDRPTTGVLLERMALLLSRSFPDSRLSSAVVPRARWHMARNDRQHPTRVRLVRMAGGFRVACRMNDFMWEDMIFSGKYEPSTTALFYRLVKPGACVFDIGANVGYFTCLAASIVKQHGKVHAFEPNPAVFPLLKKSVQINNYDNIVSIHRIALGSDAQASTPFFILDGEGTTTGGGSLVRIHEDRYSLRETHVEVITADEYCQMAGIATIDLLKIDIEGGEKLFLDGAKHLMSTIRPRAIITELLCTAVSPDAPHQLLAEFSDYGYEPFGIGHTGILTPYNEHQLGYGIAKNVCLLPRRQ